MRRMDWNVTARTGEPHVWRPLADHELDTWVLVDETPSMDFGTALSEKRDVAGWVAGSVGLLTDGPGNRVGVAHLTPTGLAWDAPLPGRVSARRTLRPWPGRRAPSAGPTRRRSPRRSPPSNGASGARACASSSATSSSPTASRSDRSGGSRRCAGCAARHDVIVVEVLDPRELELPDLGLLVLRRSRDGSVAGGPHEPRRPGSLRRAGRAAPSRGGRGRPRRRRGPRRRPDGLRLGPRPGPLHPVPAPHAPARPKGPLMELLAPLWLLLLVPLVASPSPMS